MAWEDLTRPGAPQPQVLEGGLDNLLLHKAFRGVGCRFRPSSTGCDVKLGKALDEPSIAGLVPTHQSYKSMTWRR